MGFVVPLSLIREVADLVPRYGERADSRLTKVNALEHSTEFFLNKYFTKPLYYVLEGIHRLLGIRM
jgi:hypothetical protein